MSYCHPIRFLTFHYTAYIPYVSHPINFIDNYSYPTSYTVIPSDSHPLSSHPTGFPKSPGDRKGDMLHHGPTQGARHEEAAEGVGPEGAEQRGKSQGPKPLGNAVEMAWKWRGNRKCMTGWWLSHPSEKYESQLG